METGNLKKKLVLYSHIIFFLFSFGLSQNYSLSFDGNDDYVHIPYEFFNGGMTSEFTVELWVKSLDANQNELTGLWYKGAYWQQICLRTHGGILSWFYALPQNYYGTSAGEQLSYNEWNHVAMVMDGTEMKMFRNGKLVATGTGSGSISWEIDDEITNDNNSFGRIFEDWTWQYFNGNISQFKVSSNARYLADFSPVYPLENDNTTEALYYFGEGIGDQLEDISGNNYHGTIYGCTWINDTPPPNFIYFHYWI